MGGAETVLPARMIVAGLGYRRACPASDIQAVVARATALAGVAIDRLAVPAGKSGERGVIEAAGALRLPLVLVTEAALAAAQPRCATRSARVQAAVGLASVAEAAALAAAGPGGVLLLPRIAVATATCALALAP